MNKWAQRLALEFPSSPQHGTDETDETGVVSVLSVPAGDVVQISWAHALPAKGSSPKLCAAAAELGADARELLDCLLWIHADTGAVPERELARATGWPLGVVLGAGKALARVGLIAKSPAGLQPSRRLVHELSLP
jgi:hypothetical protein